jgi:uncharacterized protein YdhG (YjbR/CyaY superfamily)
MPAAKKKATPSGAAQVREYFAKLPPAARRELKKLRDVVRSVAPDADEVISYGIPAFKLDGQRLVYIAAWKSHTSMYPLNAAMRRAGGSAIDDYEIAKGTIRFPLGEPIPTSLVKRLVKARVSEIRRPGTVTK